jgi:pyruvate kinase
MLSGETAAGSYPVEAVQEMAKICIEAENSPYMPAAAVQEQLSGFDHFSFAICGALDELATRIDARAIALLSHTWRKILLLSKSRNPRPAVICCTDQRLWRRASLLWGTAPLLVEPTDDHEALLAELLVEAEQQQLFGRNDTVVLFMGLGSDNDKSIHILNARR